MADESQEVREETTRQLDKSVVKDWNYQVEFNKRLKENEKIQREVYAHNEKQVTLFHLLHFCFFLNFCPIATVKSHNPI